MKLTLLTIACLVGVACARPKYIAIPVDDIQFLSFAPIPVQQEGLVRLPRQAPRYAAPPALAYVNDAEASEGRHARQAHHHDPHDYVDYGAHTGHHGAFGWYADFPVHADEH